MRAAERDRPDVAAAVLVRSLTAPGLKARIAEFIQGGKGN